MYSDVPVIVVHTEFHKQHSIWRYSTCTTKWMSGSLHHIRLHYNYIFLIELLSICIRILEVTMESGHSRQRMRPWLESKVEAGNIQGLAWIDRDKRIFKVPWKHGGKHDWNEADSTIFKVLLSCNPWLLHIQCKMKILVFRFILTKFHIDRMFLPNIYKKMKKYQIFAVILYKHLIKFDFLWNTI